MTNIEILVVTFAAIGVIFMLISAIGILRLPDVLARMHAVGKAATLGVSALLLSAGFFFQEGEMWRMLALIALFFITAPIATTAMARAAYRTSAYKKETLLQDDMSDPRYESTEPIIKHNNVTTPGAAEQNE
jgi:multicomponent Na+:H+ antiporter subunit G